MINLINDTQSLVVESSAAVDIHAYASWVDLDGVIVYPSANAIDPSTSGSHVLVSTPSTGVIRNIKDISIRNLSVGTSTDITVSVDDSVLPTVELIKVTLNPGYGLYFGDYGWTLLDAFGRSVNSLSAEAAILYPRNVLVLDSDITNNDASADTIADVTGLSFTMVSGGTYWFKFHVYYTAAATTTGSRWSIDGPAAPTILSYHSRYSLTTTTETINSGLNAYDLPAASNATSASTSGNIAIVEGFIIPSSSGDLILRFASEVSSSAIVAKAGSFVEWSRVK